MGKTTTTSHPYGNKDDDEFYCVVGKAIVRYQHLIMMIANAYYCHVDEQESAEYEDGFSLLGKLSVQWNIMERCITDKLKKLSSLFYGENSKDNNIIDGYASSLPRQKHEKKKIKGALHCLRGVRNAICHADFRITDDGIFIVANTIKNESLCEKGDYIFDSPKVRRLNKADVEKFTWYCEKMYAVCHDAEKKSMRLNSAYYIPLCDEIIDFSKKLESQKYILH